MYRSPTEDEALLSLNGLLKHGIASTLKSPNHGVRTGIISTPCLTTLRTSAGRFTPPTPLSHWTALSAKPSKNIRYFPVMIQPKKWCTWQLNTPVKNGRCRFITGVRRWVVLLSSSRNASKSILTICVWFIDIISIYYDSMNKEIKQRLKWIELYEETNNAGLVCRRCGISRPTLRNGISDIRRKV